MCTSLHFVLTALVRTQAAWKTETVLKFARLLLHAKNQASPICGYKPVPCYKCQEIHGYTPNRSVPPLFHLHSVFSRGLQDFMSLRLTINRASTCFFRSAKHRTTVSKVSQTTSQYIICDLLFSIFFRLNKPLTPHMFTNQAKSQRAGISSTLEKWTKSNYCVPGSVKSKVCDFLTYIWIIFYGLLFSEYTFYRQLFVNLSIFSYER